MKKLTLHSAPALVAASLYSLGILLGRRVDVGVCIMAAVVVCLLAISLLLLFRASSNTRAPSVLVFLLPTLLLVLGALKYSSDANSAAPLPDALLKRPVVITGRILESSATTGNRTRFLFSIESVQTSDSIYTISTSAFVTLARHKKDTMRLSVAQGNRFRLTGQMNRPSEERNPGEFNARAYYEAQGIPFLMRVRGYSNATIVDSSASGGAYARVMRSMVLPVREYMLSLIDLRIGGEEGELLKGIFIGERGGIPYATRAAFVNSGIAHILAVSGSNVVVVLVFFRTFFGFLRLPRAASILLTCIAILFYMVLTGSQPPIVRATIMALVVLFGKLLGERPNGLNSLGVAALIILGWDARQLFDVGFQLSFAAVLSIVYLYPITDGWIQRIQGSRWWRRPLVWSLRVSAVSIVATLGTLPMTAIYFGRVSIVGLFTNIVIIPLVGASVALGFVTSLFGWFSFFIADACAAVNLLLLKWCLEIATFSGNLSFAYVDTLQFRPVFSIPFYAGVGVAFHLHNISVARKYFVALMGSFALLMFVPSSKFHEATQGKLRVSFIDVGQGDGTLIEFPNGQTMLVDAGMKNAEYDTGERIVAPFLKRRGIRSIDYLVASHPDGDHIGGFPHLLRHFRVGTIIENGRPVRDPIYREYVNTVRHARCSVRSVRAGDPTVHIGGAKIYILSPPKDAVQSDTAQEPENVNNTSVVMKLCYGDVSILFVGDAELDAEAQMLRGFSSMLPSTILKVGHHGSITSSSVEFVNTVRPSLAVISVGLNNKFNYPSVEVLERLQHAGAEVLRTDEEGAIVLETDGTRFERVEWR